MRVVALVAGLLLASAAPSVLAQDCAGGIQHDDGSAETWELIGPWSTTVLASSFTPPSYPYTFGRVCVALANSYEELAMDLEAIVYADEDGSPGAVLARTTSTVTLPVLDHFALTPVFQTFDLSCVGPTLQSGSVWIGLRFVSGPRFLQYPCVLIDEGSDHAWTRSTDGGASWSPGNVGGLAPSTLMIRADETVVASPTATQVAIPSSGTNPAWYSASLPLVGATWTGTVDTTAYAGTPVQSRIYFYAAPALVPTPRGELLVDLGSEALCRSTRNAGPGVHEHPSLLPPDTALLGLRSFSQAFVLGDAGIVLTNGIELVAGCP